MIFKHFFGILAEYIVITLYFIKGYKILYHRWKIHKIGEIDIIAKRKNILIFIEVKARSSKDFLFITSKQSLSIKNTIKIFLSKESVYKNYDVRLDIVYVNKFLWPKVFKNCFIDDI